jgi:hypothetical protein
LVKHLSQHAGEPLSSVSEPQQLFVAVAHAALGKHSVDGPYLFRSNVI